ncbi:MAG TPA: acyl-CoA desaturase [Dehalococcoidia bacterium]|nr:acyl-CoA desaturase [Dehalococcoidia bacterium]
MQIALQAASPVSENKPGYADLRRQLAQAGLLHKRPVLYLPYVFLTLALSVSLVVELTAFSGLIALTLGALLLSQAFMQVTYIAHDAGHGQVFESRKRNRLLFHFTCFINGTSGLWWTDKHTRHHAAPNHEGIDSDIDIPILAFSQAQAESKRGFARFLVRRQGWLCLPMMTLQSIYPQVQSVTFLLRTRPNAYRRHLLALAVHHFLLASGLVLLVGPWAALYVAFVAYCLFGVHMSLAFITNHTAMPLTEDGRIQLSFMATQLRTTRNVTTNQIGDLLYGGLHYQIEHHLFPALPRPNLRKASPIIRNYVEAAGLRYDACSVRHVYGDILRHMRAVASAA